MSAATQPELIVGIDLGTTFSLISYADESGPHIIRDGNGEARLPSVIGVEADVAAQPEVRIGWAARDRAVLNPRATVYSIKRLIGKGPADIQRELPFLTYEVASGPRETLHVRIGDRAYSPEEISALILRALKQRAQAHLGADVRKAVVTVPAYFDDAQRQATRTAAEAAGLEVVRIINEPTAAALAYGIGVREQVRDASAHQAAPRASAPLPLPRCNAGAAGESAANMHDHTVAVYDLGGGTFDFSVLRIDAGVFQVLSTAGDTHLGGDDFDRLIIEMVAAEVRRQFAIEIDAPAARQALRGLAEAAKVQLSESHEAVLELDLGEGRVIRRTISREEFESAATPLVDRTLRLCDQALRDAGVAKTRLDRVILVGGSTRMPLVRQQIETHFGKEPYTALNPDEVVALGAAVQGAILSGVRSDLLLLDVLPLSLGVETLGGAMGKVIVRNTTIPARATEMFTTFVDGQTAIKLTVLQGERELAQHCRKLAEFELRGIPPMPAGIPKVEVEFLVDANGILNVSAREQRSGVEAAIQVVPNHGLTQEEIDRVLEESVRYAREDIDAHRRIDLLNQVQFDTQKCEQMLERLAAELPGDEVRQYREAIDALRRATQETVDLDELHQRLEEFGRSTLPLAERGIRAALTTPKDA